MACADRVAVMRQGRIVATVDGRQASEAGLLSLMFGDLSLSISDPAPVPKTAPGKTILELDAISTAPEDGATTLRDLSLLLRSGEILGVAGISGNGQRELAEVILGLKRPRFGAKRLWGETATGWSVARIRERGVASIPDDPLTLAIIPGLTVRENLALGSGRRYRAGLGLDWPRLVADMETSVTRLRFPPLSYDARAAVLSGGNQQRVVLTRELAHGPKLIIALYPTRGLDARGARALRELFGEARAAGAAVLLVSEDLDELFDVSDRLIVLRDGQIAGTFASGSFRADAVGRCMVGTADAA
jgi:simple sugar transport system ATP-binding protein